MLRRTVPVVLAAAVLAGCGSGASAPAAAPDACAGGPLRVAVAPELAAVVAAALSGGAAGCAPVVTAVDAADALALVAHDRAHAPDVWVPDSSAWLDAGTLPAGVPASGPSVASSPVVLAVPARSADAARGPAGLSLERVVATGRTRWLLPDPATSPVAAGAVLALDAATATSGDRAALTSVVRDSARTSTTDPAALLDRAAAGAAVPAREQAVWAADAGGRRVAAAYPLVAGRALDYPAVVVAADPQRSARARALVTSLRSARTRDLVLQAGFRDPAGVAGPALTAARGVDPAAARGARPLRPADLTTAARVTTAVLRPSRLLVVIDVSGSMADPAGGGRSRIDVASGGALTGLALYPDDTAVGLWEFATDLAPGSDHRELLPVTGLGRGPDGTSGRDRLLAALTRIRVEPHGDTGLYDTVLDAVQTMRAGWDPARQNTVVLLTDGRNDDADGLTLDGLLRRLRAGNDPTRPVSFVGLAFGPGSDLSALQAVSAAVGGRSYRLDDAAQIPAVLGDAVGRRPGT